MIILNILYWMALFGFIRLKETRWFAITVAIFTVIYTIYLFTTTESCPDCPITMYE